MHTAKDMDTNFEHVPTSEQALLWGTLGLHIIHLLSPHFHKPSPFELMYAFFLSPSPSIVLRDLDKI